MAVTEKAPKNKGGRPPRYRSEYVEQGGKLCLMGYTDQQLADFFQIGIATLYRWKKRYPEFKAALAYNKALDDVEVVNALRQSAIGYSCTEVHVSNYLGAVTVTETVKHHPPNPASLGMWLYNRQPQLFKKDPTPADDDRDTPADPLNITFGVDGAVDEVRVTRGKPKA